jgi:hypothetical protein
MTLSLLFAALLATPAPFDCNAAPWANVISVGQLSPTDARQMLKSGAFGEVGKVSKDKETARLVLETGLVWQKAGNEAMIYDVDALAFVLRGAKSSATANEKSAHKLLQAGEKITDYFKQFQFRNALRVLGTLRLMKRDVEAARLEKYLSGKHDPEQLRELRLLMSNTGRFPSHAKSVEFCKKVMGF